MTTDADAPLVATLRAAGCVAAEEEAVLLTAAARAGHGGLDRGRLEALVARRTRGEPLELVLGWAELAGTRVAVAPGVYVPRPWTDVLVALAVARLRAAAPPLVAVDLCTGSGAIACALAAAVPAARVVAADVDPVARRLAAANGAPFAVEVVGGDLDGGLPAELAGSVAVLTAVPPYVPTAHLGDVHADHRRHEPARAHDGGADGLDVARRLAVAAGRWLRPGGVLLVEIGDGQGDAAVAACAAAGLVAARVHGDEDGGDLLVEARRPD